MVIEPLCIKAFIKNSVSGTRPSGMSQDWFYPLVSMVYISICSMQGIGPDTYCLLSFCNVSTLLNYPHPSNFHTKDISEFQHLLHCDHLLV